MEEDAIPGDRAVLALSTGAGLVLALVLVGAPLNITGMVTGTSPTQVQAVANKSATVQDFLTAADSYQYTAATVPPEHVDERREQRPVLYRDVSADQPVHKAWYIADNGRGVLLIIQNNEIVNTFRVGQDIIQPTSTG